MFQIATLPRRGLKTQLLVIFIEHGFARRRQKDLSIFPKEIQSDLKDYFGKKDFHGDFKESVVLYPRKSGNIERILLVGLGSHPDVDFDRFRNLGALVSEKQRQLKAKRTHIFMANLSFCREDFIRSFTEGVLFQRYRFDLFKSEAAKKEPAATFIFVCNKLEYTPRFRRVIIEVNAMMSGVKLTRDLANHPSNELTPAILKKKITEHFKDEPQIKVEALGRKQMQTLGMNALLAVAQGSHQEPFLIVLHYKPEKKNAKKLALVGKGVTFDSGGISIKPSANMEEMKFDMSGAAAVAGIMETVRQLKPDLEIMGVIPAVENMPGGMAIKPGDIVKAYNGKTVEIINTDAEGRLILADALSYTAEKFKPDLMIDFATLTGACVVALGDKRAGLFTKEKKFRELFAKFGEESGDRVWPMPLDDIYNKELESDYADLKNIGGRWGGAITAAKFLEHFVGKTRWIHLDIAGTAYNVKHLDYFGKGATGFGPRLVARLFKQLEKIL